MHVLTRLIVAAILFPVAAWASDLPFSKRAEFSADMTYAVGEHTGGGKVYQGKDADRREMAFSGQKSVMIIKDSEVLMLMPEMGMAMRVPTDSDPLGAAYAPDESVSFKAMETETVNGEKTTKYLAESADGSGHFWFTDDGILMRVEMATDEGDMIINTTNVERGPQPDTLFEIPSGMRVMDMGGFGQVGGKGVNPFQMQ